jgi:hypothetical protein
METRETEILQKIIENFVHKNLDTVMMAQAYAKKILDYGFLEPEKTLPFQILPTNFSDSNGDVICKIYVNLENPIYGFFTIELEREKCSITCPKTYHTEFFEASFEDCDAWIDSLDQEMDVFYQISSAAEENQAQFCTMKLNEMLGSYKSFLNPQIELIKEEIAMEPRVAIVSGKMYALASEAQKDLSRALLIPPIWVVFESLDNLPSQGEDVDDYVDIVGTNELISTLDEFARQENYYSAPLYLAQRVVLQSGLKVMGMSNTEGGWVEATQSEDFGEFVLPPIDITEFEVF